MRQKILEAKSDHPVVLNTQPLDLEKKAAVSRQKGFPSTESKLSYRDTLKDGNSFYRAISIVYLSSRREKELGKALPDYDQVNLMVCPVKDMPLEIRPYYEK